MLYNIPKITRDLFLNYFLKPFINSHYTVARENCAASNQGLANWFVASSWRAPPTGSLIKADTGWFGTRIHSTGAVTVFDDRRKRYGRGACVRCSYEIVWKSPRHERHKTKNHIAYSSVLFSVQITFTGRWKIYKRK